MDLENAIVVALGDNLDGITGKELSNTLNKRNLFQTLLSLKHAGRIVQTRVLRNDRLVTGWRLPRVGESAGVEQRITQGEAK